MRVFLQSLMPIKWRAYVVLNVTDVFQLKSKLCNNMVYIFSTESFLPLTMHAYVQTFVYIFARYYYYQDANLYIKHIYNIDMMVYTLSMFPLIPPRPE